VQLSYQIAKTGQTVTRTLKLDALVLGAGAAGLLCAAEAARSGARVAVLERSDKPGKKILISGGGRCNFTNLRCGPQNFLSDNPDFCRSALARFTPNDFIDLVKKHRIPYHEKHLYPGSAEGQLFCDRSAADIVTMLLDECAAVKARIFLDTKIGEVTFDGQYRLRAKGPDGESLEFESPVLVVATGGLSIPKMGATRFGYEVARKFGHSIVPCRPALVPLKFASKEAHNYKELAGVSAMVTARCGVAEFREKLLFTHTGLSGPVILQASSYWNWCDADSVTIDLAPDQDWTGEVRDSGKKRDAAAFRTALRKVVPQRLADLWIDQHQPKSWTNDSLKLLEEGLHHWKVRPAGTEGYEKAEVTAGGVNTKELSGKSMESQKSPGLYFIGEVVDVTGWLGGYNFQWAWASAVAAGRDVASKLNP
jgi:predicted Rossmann fold flavoprotein